MSFQAARAIGPEWWRPILESMATIHSAEQIKQFNITCEPPAKPIEPNDPDPIRDEHWFQAEKKRLADFWSLLCELASARVWSQTLFSTCIPNLFAGILTDDQELSKRYMLLIRNTWQAIILAESLISPRADRASAKVKKALQKTLKYVGWHELTVSRELFAVCEAAQWDPQDSQVQLLVKLLFGSPCNTKFDLEDCFAHLASVAKLSTLATPFNRRPVTLLLSLHSFANNFGLFQSFA